MIVKKENVIIGPTKVLKDENKIKLGLYIQEVSKIFNREATFLNNILSEIPNDTREQKIVNRLLEMLRDVAEVKLEESSSAYK